MKFDQKFLDFADSASADHFDFEKYSAFADFGSADFAIADFGFAGHFDFENSMQDWSQLGYSPSVESEFAN